MRTLRSIVVLGTFLVAHIASAAITGVLMTNDGQPVENAAVALHAIELADDERVRLLSDEPARTPLSSVRSDSKGTFSLDSPDPGVYELTIFAPGYVPLQRAVEHDEDLGAIALTKGATQSGTITSNGKPLAGAVVSLRYGNAEYLARTDDKGRYSAPDPKNAHRMIVVHPDIGIDEVSRGGGERFSLSKSVSTGRELSGRVVAADGKTGVADAIVRVDQWPLATSAEDGSFTIGHAPAHWKTITAETEGLIGRRASTAAAPHVIRLGPAAVLSGRVTEVGGRSGVLQATVTLMPERRMVDTAFTVQASSDSKGAFSFAVPGGSYVLSVSHPAFAHATSEVSLAPAQELTQDVPLQRLARASGTVLDERNEPVVAATLGSEQTGSEMTRMRQFRMAEARTISGPDGRFAIRVEPDQELQIRATRSGYPEGTSEPFTLAPGARKSGVTITIPTGIAVTGRVTDADGNPLGDIVVTASATEGGNSGFSMVVMRGGMQAEDAEAVRTAADGTYTYRVKEGMHDFTFRGEGWSPKTIRSQEVSRSRPPVVDATLERAVEITGRVVRKETGVENVQMNVFAPGSQPVSTTTAADGSFTLSGLAPGPVQVMILSEFTREQRSLDAPARDVVIELPPGGRVTGRLIDKSSGKPISEFQAGVSLSRSGGGRVFVMPPQLESFTSDDGTFTLEHVPAGAMTIVGEAPGYASARSNVTVEEGKTIENVELALEPAVRLVGRVTGPTGAPLADVRIRSVPTTSTGPTFGFAGDSVSTNAAGEYSFAGLPSGEAAFAFEHEAYASARKTVTLSGRETRLDVQLAPGLAVRGMVVDENGAPVAEAEVEAIGAGNFDRVRTNAGGEFEFKSLEPGRYRITADKPGLASTTLESVDVSDGAPIRIELKAGATLYGRVLGLSPDEYPHVTVSASAGNARGRSSVDSSGSYRLQGAPTGTVNVSAFVSARGGSARSSAPKTIELTPGASRQLDIEFNDDIVIEGRVTRDGQPLTQVNVMFMPRVPGAGTFAASQSDDNGVYRITGVSDGQYTVNVFDQRQFISHTTNYDVRGSGNFDITIRTSSIRGRVIDVGTGEPLNEANVQLRANSADAGRGGMRNVLTDVQGAFSFESVSEGPYTLTATKPDYGAEAMDVNVGASNVDGLEIILSRSSGATLRAVDARNNSPLSPLAVVFDRAGRVVHDARAQVFGGGDMDLKLPLAPGSYVATVLAQGFAPRSVALQVPGAQTVQLTPGGAISIRSRQSDPLRLLVLDASGYPYPRFASFPMYRSLLPDTPAEVRNIAPGTYTVQAIASDNSVVASQQVTVREGEVTTVDL